VANLKDIPISENHRRSIAGTLGLLDEMLCRFEGWIHHGQRAKGVLYRESDTLTADQHIAIQSEIDALRKMLRELRDDLCLETKTQDVAIAIWSQTSAFWETLVQLGTRYLRRYGDMPEGFGEYFDPQVERMIEHVMRIAGAAGRRTHCLSLAREADQDTPTTKTEG
jgi:hypothetical protein